MKFSDYLNAETSPRKVTQTFNIRDENREGILEQQLTQASKELSSLKDQTNEVASLRGTNKTLTKEHTVLSTDLNNAKVRLEELTSQLDKEAHLKQLITSLQLQVQNNEEHLQEATAKANADAIALSKQDTELLRVAADKMLLETYQKDLQTQVSFAEQKREDASSELNYFKSRFSSIEESAQELMGKYSEAQKELSLTIDQKKALRTKVEHLEDDIKYNRTLNSSLNKNMLAIQNFYQESQSNLSFSKKQSSSLDETVTNLVHTLTSIEEENSYLIGKQRLLEAALAKPKYVSQSAIERQEGFKIPFASSALNMRKNQLGTGVPTLLRFKGKELTNDNTE